MFFLTPKRQKVKKEPSQMIEKVNRNSTSGRVKEMYNEIIKYYFHYVNSDKQCFLGAFLF